jgi:hypothetical protein
MTRSARLCLLALAATCLLPAAGQTQQDPLAARCTQLYQMADRAMSRRSEGSGGLNMMVQSAGIDCQKGHYEQGIRELEKVLRSQGYTVPPPRTG